MEDKIKLYREILHKCFNSDISFAGNGYEYPPMFLWDKINYKIVQDSWRNAGLRSRLYYPGLYVHIPFCLSKCNFCEFYSSPIHKLGEIDEYLDFLEKESRMYSQYLSKVGFRSIYFGGGTPSILNESQLERIFSSILYKYFSCDKAIQVAFEASPASLTRNKVRILKKFGVNRLTLGVQSLDDHVIKLSKRVQRRDHVFTAFEDAKSEGIKCINIDLMAGLPGQTFSSFKNSLDDIMKLKPDLIHVSPFHPSSPTGFTKKGGIISGLDLELTNRMLSYSSNFIKKMQIKNGKEYDLPVSNFYARNIQLIDQIQYASTYLGLGAGASSHVFGRVRYVNYMDIKKYFKALSEGKLAVYRGSKVTIKDEMIYYATVNLRNPGINKSLFKKLFNAELATVFNKELSYLEEVGIIKSIHGYYLPIFKSSLDYLIHSKIFYDKNMLSRFSKSKVKKAATF